MPPAGTLRHRIDVQTRTQTPDAAGAMVSTWTTTATLWAALNPLNAAEFQESGATVGQVSHEIRLRYYAGLTPTNRFKFGARIFDIVSVTNRCERNYEMRVLCLEKI